MSFAFLHNRSVMLLRLSLGVMFFWFGVLKLFNASPVQEMIATAIPVLGQSEFYLFLLAFVEIVLGLAFLANRFIKIAAVVMIIHLGSATIAVLLTQGFEPRFPILSLAGEFVLKNLVLIAAGLVLIAERQETHVEPHKKQSE